MTMVPMTDLTVRLGEAADVHDICRICETGFRYVTTGIVRPEVVDRQVAAYYNPDRVSREVDPAGVTNFWNGYVVAESEGEVVGAAGGGVDGDTIGHLYVLYVDLGRMRRGIGSHLLDFVSGQHRSLGATRQRVAVLEGNTHGLPFYAARGFTRVERRLYPADDPEGAPELVLERPL